LADKKNSTKVEKLSLDKVDAALNQADPNFFNSLKQIRHTLAGFDQPAGKFKFNSSLEDEKKLWVQKSRLRELIARFLPSILTFSYRYKFVRAYFKHFRENFKQNSIYFVIHIKPISLNLYQRLRIRTQDFIEIRVKIFKSYSREKQIGLSIFTLLSLVSFIVVVKLLTHQLIRVQKELFVLSLDEWAQSEYRYDKNDQVEAFYDSTRMTQNIFNFKKIWVNILQSESSGPNPMAALEFFVEGTTSEAIIEIKDREPEFGDLFLRTTEEFTYDQLVSGEGKKSLCEKLSKEVNGILTQGKIRRVYLKTAIIKP
jgi:flagellar basal body-associated protein FliL